MNYTAALKQLVLAGDLKQLPPFAITPEAKTIYKVSLLKMLMDGNFLTILLNLQFRTHNKAYDPIGHIVYEDKVESNTKISTLPPALQALLKGFPLTVNI